MCIYSNGYHIGQEWSIVWLLKGLRWLKTSFHKRSGKAAWEVHWLTSGRSLRRLEEQ
jgi:hypothetical protein